MTRNVKNVCIALTCGFLLFGLVEGKTEASKKDPDLQDSPSVKKARALFNRIQLAHQNIFPHEFRARITSSIIDQQLSSLPEEAFLFGKKPYVELLFKRGYGMKLRLRNVVSDYESNLEVVEPLLLQSGLYFGLGELDTYEKFDKQYTFEWVVSKRAAKIVEKEGFEEDYGLFYLNKKNVLNQAEYFEKNQKIAGIQLKFDKRKWKKKKLTVITGIDMWFQAVKEKKDQEKLRFTISDFNFSSLPKGVFEK